MEPSRQQKFGPYTPQSSRDFCSTICQCIWSPIIWKSGVRAKNAFLECRYVVLDFDSGTPSLEEIQEEMAELGLKYILGTTKNHRKEKVTAGGAKSPPVDRYRLVLKASEPIHDRELFEWNMSEFASWFGADESCDDGARFYYPCRDIVRVVREGKEVGWREYDADYESEDLKYARRASRLEAHGAAGTMPRWMQDILTGKVIVPEGGRHTKCVALGAQLGRMGVDEGKIVQMLMQTRLADIGEADVRRAVRNGIKSELGY